jgi:hypothetical protein
MHLSTDDRSGRAPRCAVVLFGVSLIAACAQEATSDPPPSGSGGSTTIGTGGGGTGGFQNVGSGGFVASGGSSGTAGVIGSGGIVGSGGSVSTGTGGTGMGGFSTGGSGTGGFAPGTGGSSRGGATGGGAGTTGAAGTGVTGGAGAGGGASSASGCVGKTYKLCEDFESDTVGSIPTGWTKFQGYGPSSPTDQAVATDQFHSGSKALKSISAAKGASRIQKSLATLGATASKHWGRIFYKVQSPSAVDNSHVLHTTFVSAFGGGTEDRIVDTVEAQGNHTHQWLFNTPDDKCCGMSSQYTWTFDAAWHCAEWYVDLTTKSFRFFSDSVEVTAVKFTNFVPQVASDIPAAYTAIILGATYYQGDTLTGPFTMWIDDLAIDDTQIGCN